MTVFIVVAGAFNLLWIVLFLLNPSGIQREVFFSDTYDYFMDFYNTVWYSIGKTPYTWGWLPARNYLPLCYLLMYPFSKVADYGDNPYLVRQDQIGIISGIIYMMISLFFFFYALNKVNKGKEWQKIALFLIFAVSGPMLFNYDRANQIIIAIGCLFVFLLNYKSDSKYLRHLAYICLAFASVLKIFPVIFGMLILYEKRYKEAIYAGIYGLIFTIVPFFWLNGNPIDQFFNFLVALKEHAIVYNDGSFGLLAPLMFNVGVPDIISNVVNVILALISVLGGGCLKKEWKRIAIYSLAFFLISNQQGYYCLIVIFFSIVLFLYDNEERKWTDWIYMFCFILMISPLQFSISTPLFILTSERVINTACLFAYAMLCIEVGSQHMNKM